MPAPRLARPPQTSRHDHHLRCKRPVRRRRLRLQPRLRRQRPRLHPCVRGRGEPAGPPRRLTRSRLGRAREARGTHSLCWQQRVQAQLPVPGRILLRHQLQPRLHQQRHRLHPYARACARAGRGHAGLALTPDTSRTPPWHVPWPAPAAIAAVEAKLVTVLSAQPTATCLGTQVGRFATTQADLTALGGCNALCQSGPSAANADCGTSLGVPTWCCYKSSVLWTATGAAASTVTAYPYISLPVSVRSAPGRWTRRGCRQGNAGTPARRGLERRTQQSYAPNMCLTSLAFADVEAGASCATSLFQIGLVADSDWCARLPAHGPRTPPRRLTDAARAAVPNSHASRPTHPQGHHADVGHGRAAEQQRPPPADRQHHLHCRQPDVLRVRAPRHTHIRVRRRRDGS